MANPPIPSDDTFISEPITPALTPPNVNVKNPSHSPRGLLVSLLLFLAITLYATAFWGNALGWLPEPLSQWKTFLRQALVNFHHNETWLWVATQFVIGLAVPATLWRLCGRRISQAGMGRPNVLGGRLVLASVLVSIPFGFWLIATTPAHFPPPSPARYLPMLLVVIPEHFFICGLCIAAMLPGRALPCPTVAPVSGSLRIRALRWLGLAQPSSSADRHRVLTWLGLTGMSLAAILASGLLFGLVHIGKTNPTEVLLSFPGGVAVAYVTLRCGSIWPAVVAHWTMNLIPLGLLAIVC